MSQIRKKQAVSLASFYDGLGAGSPIIAGIIPFALIYGAAARDLNFELSQTVLMSLIMFAGASQLVFLDMWGHGATLLALVLTGLTVNLRMAMYSASITTKLGRQGGFLSVYGAYLLTDEAYGLAMGRFLSDRQQPLSPFYFYVGAALPTWLSWQLAGAAGYLGGSLVPDSWPLYMAVPLVFFTLLIPMLGKGPKLTAALAAMLMAIVTVNAPLKLGLVFAVACGVAAGYLHELILGSAHKNIEKTGGDDL